MFELDNIVQDLQRTIFQQGQRINSLETDIDLLERDIKFLEKDTEHLHNEIDHLWIVVNKERQ